MEFPDSDDEEEILEQSLMSLTQEVLSQELNMVRSVPGTGRVLYREKQYFFLTKDLRLCFFRLLIPLRSPRRGKRRRRKGTKAIAERWRRTWKMGKKFQGRKRDSLTRNDHFPTESTLM